MGTTPALLDKDVANEVARILPLLKHLSPDNTDLLLDITEDVDNVELADRYTSGDKRTLERRLRGVLIHHLGFDSDLPMVNMVQILKAAFAQ